MLQIDQHLSPPASAPARRAARKPRKAVPAGLQMESSLGDAPETVAPARAASGPVAPHAVSARDQREADARYAEGQRALTRGEPKTAEQNLRDALSMNPHLHAARDALVALLIDQNRLEEAQTALDEGLAYEPQRNAFRRLAARLALARGQPQLAVQQLEVGVPTVAADPEYHGLLASAYQRLNRHEDAARIYQSLAQLQPGEAHWWAGYGISRDALGDVPGALAAYAQARQLGHLDPRVLEHINRRTAALQSAG
jgi:MSHA biogenesis protein MshN